MRELGRFDERGRTKRDRGKERWRNMEEVGRTDSEGIYW